MMFLDESGRWRIASKSEHYDKGTDICYTMGVGFLGALPFTGDDNPGTWETYNDGAWKPCDQAMTIPIMKRSSPVHRSKKSFFETKSMDESLPGISLKPQDSRGYRKGNPGKNSDGIGRFPNFGMSLKFLRQIRNDPRLLQPMYSLPYVSSFTFFFTFSLSLSLSHTHIHTHTYQPDTLPQENIHMVQSMVH